MTTNDSNSAAVAALVEAMLTSCGQLATIFDHMERHRYTGPDAEAPPVVLGALLAGIFEALPVRHGVEDVATAAQMLSAATDLVADELFLVEAGQEP
jgi:hypothetical protein